MNRLTGKNLIVTGAASGIGSAGAAMGVREGARALLCDIDETAGKSVAAKFGEAAVFFRLDVQNEDDWKLAVTAAHERFGRIDGVANIAGIDLDDDNVEVCSPETWDTVMRVNLDGVFLGTKHGILTMKLQDILLKTLNLGR